MGRNILLGFAGPGKVSHTNVKDLLKDYLSLGKEDKQGLPAYPDDVDEIRVVIPAAEDWWTPTVELLWQWADEYAEFPYEAIYDVETRKNRDVLDGAKEAIEAKNVGFTLVERLVEGKKDGSEVTLIVAWGESGDDATELLVELAQTKGLVVKDITAGLDDQPKLEDLNFSDPEPEPEPEEQPARRGRRTVEQPEQTDQAEPADEEKPRPRRGAPRKAAETAPAPAEGPQAESVEQEVSHARQRAQKPTEASSQDYDVVLDALLRSRALVTGLDASHAAMSGRDEPVPCELYRLLGRAIDKHTGAAATDESLPAGLAAQIEDNRAHPERGESRPERKRTAGRPRSDGSPAQPRSARQRGVKEWFDEDQGKDGEWVRAGRGRLPKDVKTRTVDPKSGEVISEP